MGAISDLLISVTEEVVEWLNLADDDETFDAVQNWIIENVNLADLPSSNAIAESFRSDNVCPQCQTIIRDHHHNCFAMERT
jgi:hypothetical protein